MAQNHANDPWYHLSDNSVSLLVAVSKVEGAALSEVPVPPDYTPT